MSSLTETLRQQLGQYVDYCIEHIEKIEKIAAKDATTSRRVVAAFSEMEKKFIDNPSKPFVFSASVLTGLCKDQEIVGDLKELVAILRGESDILPFPVNLDGAQRVVGAYSQEELRGLQQELCKGVAIKIQSTIKNLREKRNETEQEHTEIRIRKEGVRAENLAIIEQVRRRNTFEGALELVQQNGLKLEGLNPILQNNKDIVLAAVTQNGRALQFAHPRLQNDNDVVKAALQHEDSDFIFQHVGQAFRENREQLLQAIRTNEMAIGYGQDELVEDRAFIIDALRENPMVLQLLSEPLRNDYELVTIALEGIYQNEAIFIQQIVGNEIRPRVLEETLRGQEILKAVRIGDSDRVQAVLPTGAISKHYNKMAFQEALEGVKLRDAKLHNHLNNVRALLAHGATISETDEVSVVNIAAERGYLEIVHAILAMETSSKGARDSAFVAAANQGNIAFMRAIATIGEIEEDTRDLVVLNVFRSNRLDIVEAILELGTISITTRGEVVKEAAHMGLLKIVEKLLQEKINDIDRIWAVRNAAYSGHADIVTVLLESGEIPERHMTMAIESARNGGHTATVEALLKRKG